MELRRKLEAHGPRLIQTLRGRGYLLGAPPAAEEGHEPGRPASRPSSWRRWPGARRVLGGPVRLGRVYLRSPGRRRLDAALDVLAAAAEVEPEGVEWEPQERRPAPGPGARGRAGSAGWSSTAAGHRVDRSREPRRRRADRGLDAPSRRRRAARPAGRSAGPHLAGRPSAACGPAPAPDRARGCRRSTARADDPADRGASPGPGPDRARPARPDRGDAGHARPGPWSRWASASGCSRRSGPPALAGGPWRR